MFNNKQRFSEHRDMVFDPIVLNKLLDANASSLNEKSRELDMKRMKSIVFDGPFNKVADEADRLAHLSMKDMLPLPIDDSHRRLMNSSQKIQEYKRRNEEWSKNQSLPLDDIQKQVAPILRQQMEKQGIVKEILLPFNDLTEEDYGLEKVHYLKGLKQVFLQPLPKSLDL